MSAEAEEPRTCRATCVFAESQYGIIAGGLVDGTVNLWNPAKILGTDVNADQVEDGSPLISKLQKHTGGVRAHLGSVWC